MFTLEPTISPSHPTPSISPRIIPPSALRKVLTIFISIAIFQLLCVVVFVSPIFYSYFVSLFLLGGGRRRDSGECMCTSNNVDKTA
jgi:hypothetical protein